MVQVRAILQTLCQSTFTGSDARLPDSHTAIHPNLEVIWATDLLATNKRYMFAGDSTSHAHWKRLHIIQFLAPQTFA